MKTKYKTEEAEVLNSVFNFPSYQENRISGATVKPPPASSLPFPAIRFFYGQLPPPPATGNSTPFGMNLRQLDKTSENTGNHVEETWVRVGKLEHVQKISACRSTPDSINKFESFNKFTLLADNDSGETPRVKSRRKVRKCRGGAKKTSDSEIFSGAIKTAKKHGINLIPDEPNSRMGDCLFESVSSNINRRNCFTRKVSNDMAENREVWVTELEEKYKMTDHFPGMEIIINVPSNLDVM